MHASTKATETKLYSNSNTGVTDLTDTNDYSVRIGHAKSADRSKVLPPIAAWSCRHKKKGIFSKVFS